MIQNMIIKRALDAVIKKINSNIDMGEVMSKYNADDGRTMVVAITDLGEDSGFSVVNGKLMSGIIENPTCTVFMSKNVLGAILTNKLTHSQAFLLGEIDIRSDAKLRDSIVLNRIFKEMKDTKIL